MSNWQEVFALDALGQAELIRRGEIAATELLEAVIEQIERLNPKINAVPIKIYDMAREQAANLAPGGVFAGVPFLVKDLLAEIAGAPYTAGSAYLKDYISPRDNELVRRYRKAGLIFVGKTNTPEFGVGPYTEPRLFGPARNPWDLSRTTGGSSGGSAAAVAAGIVPMAHGNDGGGSIRIPAACCGVFGMKPTRARNPLGPYYGDLWGGFIMEHALTRSVRDSAALLDATAGPDVGDPYTAPAPKDTFLEAVSRPPRRLRIAFTDTTQFGEKPHPEARAAVEDAAKLCEELGHDVEEAAPEFDGELLWEGYTKTVAASAAAIIDDLARLTGKTPTEDDFEGVVWRLAQAGREMTAAEAYLIRIELQRLSRQYMSFFETYDVLITPTIAQPPIPIGYFNIENFGGDAYTLRRAVSSQWIPYTSIHNATGQPAMSVPLYWTPDGLPLGTNFSGRFGDEETLFQLAGQLERARPWADRRPPVSVFSD